MKRDLGTYLGPAGFVTAMGSEGEVCFEEEGGFGNTVSESIHRVAYGRKER